MNKIATINIYMEGIESQKPEQRGEILMDKSKLFHGIGFDLIRYKSILEHGILSENAAYEKGVNIKRNFQGYNLNDTVSVTESPSVHKTFTSGAFGTYIRPGISFVIEGIPIDSSIAFRPPPQDIKEDFRSSRISKRASGYIDEAYVIHEIPKENLQGVMIPEDSLDKPLSELPLGLAKMGHNFIENRCRSLITDLAQEIGFSGDITQLEELIKSKEELENSPGYYSEKHNARQKLLEQMDKFMQEYIHKAFVQSTGQKQVTLRDVLKKYTPADMPIYNSDGMPINLNNDKSQDTVQN